MIRQRETQRIRRGRVSTAVIAAVFSAALVLPGQAWAHDHDPERSGHPLRILAYALHPVGYVIDLVVFRPFHWLGHQNGVREVFGHDDR